MKAPSTDLMVKIALGAGVVLAVFYVVNRGLKSAIETGSAVAHAINPLNNDNVIYQTANTVTGGTEDRPLGVRIYDLFHPGE